MEPINIIWVILVIFHALKYGVKTVLQAIWGYYPWIQPKMECVLLDRQKWGDRGLITPPKWSWYTVIITVDSVSFLSLQLQH